MTCEWCKQEIRYPTHTGWSYHFDCYYYGLNIDPAFIGWVTGSMTIEEWKKRHEREKAILWLPYSEGKA